MQKTVRTRCRQLGVWLAMLICFNGQVSVKAADQDKDLLINSVDLFQYPESFMERTIAVTASVLCLDEDHCVIQNPLNPATFLRFDTKKMALIDKLRLARECYQVSCSELAVGVRARSSFNATASYEVKLPLLLDSANHQSNKLNPIQIPFLQSQKTILPSCKNIPICSSYRQQQWTSLLQDKLFS